MSPASAKRSFLGCAAKSAALAVLALVALRALFALTAPWIASLAAHSRGLECEWDSLCWSSFAGELEIRGLVITEQNGKPGDEPLLAVDYADVDLALSRLFAGEVCVARVELDGVRARISRAADGSSAWVRALGLDRPDRAAHSAAPKQANDEPAADALDFGLPVQVRALRVQHLELHVDDRAVAPALDARVVANLRLNDLGRADAAATFECFATSRELLDSLRVTGEELGGPRQLHVAVDFALDGVRCAPLAPYLAAFGLSPHARELGAGARLALELEPDGSSVAAARAKARLTEVHLDADGAREFALDELGLDAVALTRGAAHVTDAHVRGVRSRASRLATGVLRAAGLDFVGGAASAPARAASAAPPSSDATTPGFALVVDRAALERVELGFHDEVAAPAADFALAIPSIELQHVELGANAATSMKLAARLEAPGLFDALAIDGEIARAAAHAKLGAQVHAAGLDPRSAATYLAPLGLACELGGATFDARLAADFDLSDPARPKFDAELADLALESPSANGPVERLRLAKAAVGGGVLDSASGALAIERVECSGLRLDARRDVQGAWHAVGFAFSPASAAALHSSGAHSAPSSALPTSTTAASSPPRSLEVAHLALHDERLTFVDEFVAPARQFTTQELALDLDGLALGASPPSEARLRASLAIPNLVESATLEGTLGAKPGALDLELALALRATGLRTTELRPYGAALGVEPTLQSARFAADLHAHVAQVDADWILDCALEHVELAEGDASLAAVESLKLEHANFGANQAVNIGAISIAKPSLAVHRDAQGALETCGVRLVAKPDSGAETEPPNAPPSLEVSLPELHIGTIAIDAASLAWRDSRVAPEVALAAKLDLHVQPLAMSSGASAPDVALRNNVLTRFDARIALADGAGQAIGEARTRGRVLLDPQHLLAESSIAARGLHLAVLAPYLPPNVRLELADGAFEVALRASSNSLAEGGRSFDFSVGNLTFSDGSTPLAKLGSFESSAARVDPALGVYELGAVGLHGVELSARRSKDGALHALGLAFEPSSKTAPEPASSTATATTTASAVQARAHKSNLTRLALEGLELELARLEFTDEAQGAAAAPIVASAKLALDRAVLFDAAPQDLPPFALHFTSSAAPLADSIALELKLAPYALDPRLDGTFALRGLHGEGLTKLAPELAAKLDGSALANGTADGEFACVLHPSRKSSTDFDWSRGIGGEFTLSKLAFRGEPNGPVLAGLDSARVDLAKFDPATGDVAIRSVELEKPIGRIARDAGGVHALGFALRPTPNETAPAETAAAPSAAPAVAPAPDAHPSELSIGRVSVSKLDFELRDETATPPLVVPLTDLDLEVRKFTTRAFREHVPIHFALVLGAGNASLPVRVDSSNALTGVARAVGEVAKGAKEELKFEDRALFDEVALSGRIAFVPALEGWVTLGVGALELPAFRGLAQANGVTLGDGLLDATVRVRLQGERGISIEARPALSYLSLSEPAGGPISRYLSLPAPLDTVLFLLKDAEGEHKLPINLHLGSEGLTTSEIVSAAVGATTRLIARAAAGAPLRVLGSVGGLFGIGGGEELPPSKDAIALEFAPGVATIGAAQRAALVDLVQKLHANSKWIVSLVHHASADDLARAERLANPDASDCRELSNNLRARKAELVRRRDELAPRARVDYAVGRADEAHAATDELRAIDREIGLAEDALDRVHELMRPGAERRRDQRTRSGLIAIAVERVARVKAALIELGLAEERIEVRAIRNAVDAPGNKGSLELVPHRRQ